MRFRLLTALTLGLLGLQSAHAVVIDGKDWMQLTGTTGLSYLQANTLCGSGTCSGSIGSTSIDGWSWATNADVASLFDSLIQPGTTQFPTATSTYAVANDADIANAITNVFNPTSIFNLGGTVWREVRGMTFGASNDTTTMAYLSDSPFATTLDYAAFDTTWPTNLGDGTTGLWLYKSLDSAPVPEPGTIALLGVAAIGLLVMRRKRALNVC
jgi:hypothetical protein